EAVESLEPLAVLDISLASGNLAYVPGIDQKHLDAGNFQLLAECYPVDPGRLDGHGRDPASFQPLDQGIQSFGESAEAAHKRLARLNGPRRHSDVMFLGSAINTARRLQSGRVCHRVDPYCDRADPHGVGRNPL